MKYTVLDIPSRLDHRNMDQTREIIEEGLDEESPMLILNFGQCEYMDSSGLGLLVHTATTREKDVRLVELRPKIRSILKLTQVDRILRVFNTLDNALAKA